MSRFPYSELPQKILKSYTFAPQEAVDFLKSMKTIPFHVAILRLCSLVKTKQCYITIMALLTSNVVLTKEELDLLVLSEDPMLVDVLAAIVGIWGGVITHVDGSKTFILHELCKNLTAGNWRARQFFNFLEMSFTEDEDEARRLQSKMASLKDEYGSIPLDYLGPEVELCYRQLLTPRAISHNPQLSPM